MKPEKRVEVWNTFFMIAREQAINLNKAINNEPIKRDFIPKGGILPDIEYFKLTTILMCYFAIESRINHLIMEFKEKKEISDTILKEFLNSNTKIKWQFLPLYTKGEKISYKDNPHKAISEICKRRNGIVHVDYGKLENNLKKISPKKTLGLFKQFVHAMENMNVLLKRISKERKNVLKIGKI